MSKLRVSSFSCKPTSVIAKNSPLDIVLRSDHKTKIGSFIFLFPIPQEIITSNNKYQTLLIVTFIPIINSYAIISHKPNFVIIRINIIYLRAENPIPSIKNPTIICINI